MNKIDLVLLQDTPEAARFFSELVDGPGKLPVSIDQVQCLEDAFALLEQRDVDAVLLDLSLPEGHGLEALAQIRDRYPSLPVIILTENQDEDLAVSAVQHGAQDYLVKGECSPSLLMRSIRYAIERKRAEVLIRDQEKRFRKLLEHSSDVIVVLDSAGNLLFDSSSEARFLGYAPGELSCSSVFNLIHPDDLPRITPLFEELLQNPGQPVVVQMRCRHKQGTWVWVEAAGSNYLAEPAIQGVVMNCRDITVRKHIEDELRDSEARLRGVVESLTLSAKVIDGAAEGIFITDHQGIVLSINPAFTAITGYEPNEIVGSNIRDYQTDQHDPDFMDHLLDSLEIIGQWQGEIWCGRKDRLVYPELLTISTVRDSKGEVANLVGIFTDITIRKQAEDRLKHLASHDSLTGLANRELFQDRLEQALARARRINRKGLEVQMVAVALLDLDHFKDINDTYGHDVGDQLIVAVADRLSENLRECDTIARMGGDEFTIVLENLKAQEDCYIVAEKIQALFSRPFVLDRCEVYATASIGISVYPDHGKDSESLFKNADIAMYTAKERRNGFRFFDQKAKHTTTQSLFRLSC